MKLTFLKMVGTSSACGKRRELFVIQEGLIMFKISSPVSTPVLKALVSGVDCAPG